MDKIKYQGILESEMLSHAQENMPPGWIFQHDRDPKHTSNHVKTWLAGQNINILDWPAQSPDLNPIEHLWSVLDRQIRHKKHSNLNDFMTSLQEEWKNISPDCIAKLVDSLPDRCRAVIASKGFPTKY